VILLSAALGGLYALLAPSWYSSELTVVPTMQQKSGSLSSMLGAVGGLAPGLESSLGGADTARIAAVMQSISVTDAVIERFDLRARYAQKYQEGAREVLWKHCDVMAQTKPNLVQLTCEDKDPRFVQQMLAFFAQYGNQVFRRVGASSASEEVRFLEKRMTELRQQADESAARMREFQEKHQIVDLDTQSKAVVSALAALQAQRISKQMELEYARTFSSRDEATMQQLQSQLSVMDDKVRDLEVPAVATPPDGVRKRSRRRNEATGGMFPAVLAVPKLRAEIEKLYRDRKLTEGTLVFGLERLEAARANEARDVSTFVVLDPPALPTRRSRPRRATAIVLATVVGLAAALAFEWWKSGGTATWLSAGPTRAAPYETAAPRMGSSRGAWTGGGDPPSVVS
jgi:capsule polysaccharide export protein KpsE/RkpR